jgi:hypothetical protein
MILILAHPEDLAAKSFVAFAERSNIKCCFPEKLEHVSICVESDRNGMTNVTLRHGGKTSPVRSIFNRGLPGVPAADAVGSFEYSEMLAAWWTALACFKGQVINRSNHEGFISPLDVLSFSQCGFHLAPTYITSKTIPDIPERKINFHRTRTGELLKDNKTFTFDALPDGEVVNLTGFDPNKTFYAILAGNKWINPSDVSGEFDGEIIERLQATREILTSKSVNFGLLVLQHHEQEVRLIHATPFPALAYYRNISDHVNQSLLNYLIT